VPGELNFTTHLHKDSYEVMPSPQQAYVLFEIMPTAAAPGISQALNFNLVLDRSGSMAGNRMNQMKQAAKLVVDRLGPLDTLSIVIFDETADVVIPSTLVQDKDAINGRLTALTNVVARICPVGCKPDWLSFSVEWHRDVFRA
jgi:Ca-activated chloride channel homolog